MQYSDVSDLPVVEEEQATEPVAQIYADIKREMQLPIIPNLIKALAVSPAALTVEDYARVREPGLVDEDLVEITLVSAAANCVETPADALKIEVDPMVTATMGG